MNTYEHIYLELIEIILDEGHPRESRVGTTHQVFGTGITVGNPANGFPLLTTRRMYMQGIAGELAAFLMGATRLSEFRALGCNYWDANAEAWEHNRHRDPGDYLVGNIYGAQWRKFGKNGIDQIAELQESLTTNPFSRRHLLTTYDPSTLGEACLPPCHLLTQFNVTNEGELDAVVYMRSVDVCLGLPTDVALYALLLLVTAQSVKLKPGNLVFMMGDTHVYTAHTSMARKQLEREVLPLPGYKLNPDATLDNFAPSDFELVDYQHHEPLHYTLLA